MTTLRELSKLERQHWELHLKAVLKDTLSLRKEVNMMLKGGGLPNIKHPAYIHDWMEHPEMRPRLEAWHG